jgi:hypothetical protein
MYKTDLYKLIKISPCTAHKKFPNFTQHSHTDWDFKFSRLRRCRSWVFILKMEAIRSSETLVTTYKTTRRHNPEDQNRHSHTVFRLSPYHSEFSLSVGLPRGISPYSHIMLFNLLKNLLPLPKKTGNTGVSMRTLMRLSTWVMKVFWTTD